MGDFFNKNSKTLCDRWRKSGLPGRSQAQFPNEMNEAVCCLSLNDMHACYERVYDVWFLCLYVLCMTTVFTILLFLACPYILRNTYPNKLVWSCWCAHYYYYCYFLCLLFFFFLFYDWISLWETKCSNRLKYNQNGFHFSCQVVIS